MHHKYSCWHFQSVFTAERVRVERQSLYVRHWWKRCSAWLPLCSLLQIAVPSFTHTPVAFLAPSTHTFVCQRDIFIVLKERRAGGLTGNVWRKVSVAVEMCFWWTGAHLCTSDKKMFTIVADLFSCPFEVSIYSTALYLESVFSQ